MRAKTRKRSTAAPRAARATSGPLAGYLGLEAWRTEYAGPFFPTGPSLAWFIKCHRAELVQAGALITRDGQAGSLVHVTTMASVVEDIFKREARQRAGFASGETPAPGQ